jgi:hypothetical protein
MTASATALVAATAVHLGFQATVTTVVYPALARVPAEQWAAAHRAHSRAITPVVAVVYATLASVGAWSLLSGPDGWASLALAATTVAVLVTAVAAAPAHGRLGAGYDAAGIRRLRRIDVVRSVAAGVALVAAVLAA